jgi:hypothetical protein
VTTEDEDVPFDFGGFSSDRAARSAGGATGGAKGAGAADAKEDQPGTRKITLTISWPEGTKDASFTLTEYVARLVARASQAGAGGTPTGSSGSLSSPATSEKNVQNPAPKQGAR